MKKIVVILLTMILAIVAWPQLSLAQESHTFQVMIAPQFNNNQQLKSYYDILAQPGEKLTLPFKITNDSDKETQFDLSFNPALTNSTGSIEYSGNVASQILKGSPVITDYGSLSETQVTLAPGANKEVNLEILMPPDKFPGKIAGGVRVAEIPSGQTSGNIRHTFAREVAVILQNEVQEIEPELHFTTAEIVGETRRKSLKIGMENRAPAYLSRGSIQYTIRKGQQKLLEETKNLRVSPSTAFDYQIPMRDGDFGPGNYQVDLSVSDNKTDARWNKTLDFTIDPEVSQVLNEDSKQQSNVSLLTLGLIGLIAALLAVIGYMLYRNHQLNRKRR